MIYLVCFHDNKTQKKLHILIQRQENGPLMDAIIPYKATNRRIFYCTGRKVKLFTQKFVFKCVHKNLFLVHMKIARIFFISSTAASVNL